MEDLIETKGIMLNRMTAFWFRRLESINKNHLTDIHPDDIVQPDEIPLVHGRSVVAYNLRAIPYEAVVRGYLVGSGWKDYQETGSVCGIELPKGLRQAEKLPEPIFTPATKAPVGEHDQNISFAHMAKDIGYGLARLIREKSLQVYKVAAALAYSKGMIIADTKFEWGLDEYGNLTLMDEVLTPDSSRFWPIEGYAVGINPPSYDKQFVRDYLEAVRINGKPWDKTAPAPRLPPEVIVSTRERYHKALIALCT
jgi:phosphoribosylaminoimidazole-succinocarboxamide synthase